MLCKLRGSWDTLGFFLLIAWFWHWNGWQPLLMLLSAALTHEAGHLLALRLFGAPMGGFHLSAAGAVMQTDDLYLSYLQEFFAVLAGPAANLTAGLVLNTLSPAFSAYAGAHFVLGLFNLLPAAPLDGWRIVQLVLCWLLDPVTGNRCACLVGGMGSILLTGGILCLMVFSGGNLWLFPAALGIAVSGLKTVGEYM